MTDQPASPPKRDKYPWSFHAYVAEGETNPMVALYIGPKIYDDITGKSSIVQDAREPLLMPLSELPAMLATDPGDLGDRQQQQMAERQSILALTTTLPGGPPTS